MAGWIALALTNDTGGTITSFTVGFSGEQWRNGGNTNAQTMTLGYGFGATFTTVSSWIAPGGNFDWTSPVATSSASAIDGNAAGKQSGRGGTVSSLNWASGTTLWIRWVELNDAGNDHGLAIDDLSFSATVATPRSLVWNPPGTDWNTTGTNKNWLDGATAVAFAGANDTVNFTDAGLAAGSTVTVDAGGVTPAAVNVSNTTGVYTLTGGAIGGAGPLTKSNAGELILAGSNTYTGNTIINGGTVSISSNANLGDNASDIVLAGGALRTTANVTLNAGRTISGSGVLDARPGTTMTVNGSLTGGSIGLGGTGTVQLAGAGNSATSLVFTDAGVLELAGTDLVLSGANKSVSTTFGSGTARIAGTGALDFGASTGGTITVAAGGTLMVDRLKSAATVFISKMGTGTLALTGDNPGLNSIRVGLANSTTPTDGGVVSITSSGALGTGSFLFNNGTLHSAGAVTVANDFSIGGGQVGDGAVFDGDITVAGTTTLFRPALTSYQHRIKVTAGKTATLSGALGLPSGTGTSTGLTIAGPGTLVIGAASNDFNLPITVDGATVAVNGAMTSSAASFTLQNAGTLRGTGPIAGAVDSGDGMIAPGNSIGNLTTGGQTWAPGGTYEWEIASAVGTPGSAWDHISMTSLAITATSGNKFTVKLVAPVTPVGFDPDGHYTWKVATVSGAVSGFDALVLTINRTAFPSAHPQGKFSMIQIGGDISIHYVPEPASTFALAALATLLRRRRAV